MPREEKPDIKHSDLSAVADAAPATSALVKSAGRVLEILEFFDEMQREARVSEVAERLNFPQSSASVLLKCLGQLGYLDFDANSRTYLPTLRVTLLGTWLDKGPVRDGSLIRMMEELSQKTGHAVLLAARNGIYSHYIHVLQARTQMRFLVPHGSRRLVTWSATGFALLGRETDEMARALCLRTNAESAADKPKIDLRRMLANIRRTREAGYFFSKGLVTPGAGAIGMPLPEGIDRRDRPLAIGLSGPLNDFIGKEEAIVELMRNVIERYLGGRKTDAEGRGDPSFLE